MNKILIELSDKVLEIRGATKDTMVIKTGPNESLSLDVKTIEFLGKVILIPDWVSGTEIIDCDGYLSTYIGPNPCGTKAVVAVRHTNEYVEMHWSDISSREEVEGPDRNQEAVNAAFPE